MRKAHWTRGRWPFFAVLVVSLATFSSPPAVAQSASSATPGTHALVLSTGASRGFAHAGVLAVLDSVGYDPDIVVGASMGAIIGAMYASGYSPTEIWTLASSAEWGAVFMNP